MCVRGSTHTTPVQGSSKFGQGASMSPNGQTGLRSAIPVRSRRRIWPLGLGRRPRNPSATDVGGYLVVGTGGRKISSRPSTCLATNLIAAAAIKIGSVNHTGLWLHHRLPSRTSRAFPSSAHMNHHVHHVRITGLALMLDVLCSGCHNQHGPSVA